MHVDWCQIANALIEELIGSDKSVSGKKCQVPPSRHSISKIQPPRHSESAHYQIISSEDLEKRQHFRMSSPKTTQPITRQQHPRGILVRSNLLSLKQIEKSPGNHRAFSFGGNKWSTTPLFGHIWT
jgi:hypothetical protein